MYVCAVVTPSSSHMSTNARWNDQFIRNRGMIPCLSCLRYCRIPLNYYIFIIIIIVSLQHCTQEITSEFDTQHSSVVYAAEDISTHVSSNMSTSVINWFKSYVYERSQSVTIGGHISKFLPSNTCVPQGSILGQLLFIIYSSDLPLCLPLE